MALTPQQQRAINDFLSENWSEFAESALKYLAEEEITQLGEELQEGL